MPPVDNNDRRIDWVPATQAVVAPSEQTWQFTRIPLDIPAEIVPAGFHGRSPMYGDWKNFGPRVGFAYRLNDKTAVRGGYGVYYGELIASCQDNFGPGSQDVFSSTSLRLYNTAPIPTLRFPNLFGNSHASLGVCATEAGCGDSITATCRPR